MSEKPSDLRGLLDNVLGDTVDADILKEIVAAALAATKTVNPEITCKHCKRVGKYPVQISDAKAVMGALEILMNQTQGRPDVAQQEESERIIFQRVVDFGDEVKGVAV